MASVQEAVRRLTIQSQTVGITQSTAELDALARAQGGVAVASNATERATLSLDSKFAAIERRYNTALRNQQDYAKLQSQVNAAVAQNPALQDRANAVMASAAERYGQLTGAQKAMAAASNVTNLQIAALAGNLGVTGQVLSAFGPWGFAAAVGLGAVGSAISFVSDKTHELAAKAKEIKDYAEATGFTTLQFQALRSEVGRFGIDSETLAAGASKFTVGFNELRNGSGQLLTEIRRLNPALAEEMQRTTDTATAFTLFGKAVQSTDNIFQRNALLRAGLGKGSTVYGAFFESAPDVAKITAAYAAAGKGIDDNLIHKLAQLQIDIEKTRSAANTVFASMFGTSTLQSELDFANGMLKIATYAKEFKFSADFQKFIDFLSHPATLTALGLLAAVPLVAGGLTVGTGALAVGGAALVAGGAVGGVTRLGANDNRAGGPTRITVGAMPSNFVSPANDYKTFQGSGSSAGGELTDLAKLAALEKTVAMLGSAASASEKYELAILKLKMGQDGLTLSGEKLTRAQEALRLDRDAATIGARVGALGSAASATDLLAQKQIALKKANEQGAGLTPVQMASQIRLTEEQLNGVAAVNAQIDALKIQAATTGMSAGAAAEYTAVETKRLEAIRNGAPLDEKQLAALREKAAVLGQATQAAAQDAAQAQANFERQTVFLSDTDKQIAQIQYRLHGNDWQAWMNDGLSSSIKLNDNLKVMSDSLKDVGKSAFSAALSGANGMNSLVGALDGVAKKLADKAFDNLLSGDPMQMGIGALQAGASAAISVFTRDEKNAAALKKAQAEWDKAGPAFQAFLKQMSGGVTGNLSQTIQDAAAREADFEDKAWKARDTAAINAARSGLQHFSDTQKILFQATFQATIDGLKDGLGPDSPFLKAVASVKTALNTQLAFIDDTDVAIGENIPGAMAKAKAASQAYLLSLLQTPQSLSAVQSGMLQIQGTANALQGALVQLGMSSADAASAISKGVTRAVNDLKAQFEKGLTTRLNTANGASFLNDAAALLVQHQQDLADVAALGNDPALMAQVATLFRAEAQKIVNDAGLVGDAFADFTKQFPALADVVTESSAAIEAAAKQQQAALNSSAKTILDYVNGLTAGPNSSLSPQDHLAAAQAAYNAKLVLAQSGNADAQASITQDAENYRQAALAMFGSTAGYQDILTQIKSQLLALPAVRNTEDPVLVAMRDVLGAINAGNATQALDATLQNVIKAAIDAGNAQQVAAALLPTMGNQLTFAQFVDKVAPLAKDTTAASLLTSSQVSSLGLANNTTVAQLLNAGQLISALGPISHDTTVGSLLTQSQLQNSGLAANATVGSVQSAIDAMNGGNILRIFQELDGNGNGILEKSEAIAGATGTTSGWSYYIAGKTDVQNNKIDSGNTLTDAGNSTLAAIQGLQATANQQLVLMTSAYDVSNGRLGSAQNVYGNSFNVGQATSTTGVVVQNQMVQALNKIVWNTFVIANNTSLAVPQTGGSGAGHLFGTYAAGGLVTGPGTGTSDSIRAMLSNREYVMPAVRVEQFGVGFFDQLRAGIMPRAIANDHHEPPYYSYRDPQLPWRPTGNDNDDAEIRALREEVRALTAAVKDMDANNVRATVVGAQHIAERVDRVADATQDVSREQKFNQVAA